ncbi:MAG: glycoside hydrolase family 43 protein [Pseudomonadota bacterium]
MMRALLLVVAALLVTLGPRAFAQDAYLFSSFRDNGQDGLHLAYSADGLNWMALNNDKSYLAPQVGGHLMRDPCIIEGPDGQFHMVWTTGWWENNIGIAHSRDLIHWSAETMLPVMASFPGVMNTWAPEIFYDAATRRYLIFWASAVPGAFPETADRGDIRSTTGLGINHRIYYTTTRDFRTYAPTAVFYDGGFVSIDATLVRDGARYIMFIKDETKRPEPAKNIRIAIAAAAGGPYGPASTPISPPGLWAEGPTAIKIGDQFYLYYDAYMSPQHMGAARSRDLIHWEDITGLLHFPEGTRHGSVLRVDRAVLDRLLAAQGTTP